MEISQCTIKPSFRFAFLTSHSMKTCLETRMWASSTSERTQDCHASRHPRQWPADVRTHPPTTRMSAGQYTVCHSTWLSASADGMEDGYPTAGRPLRASVRRQKATPFAGQLADGRADGLADGVVDPSAWTICHGRPPKL